MLNAISTALSGWAGQFKVYIMLAVLLILFGMVAVILVYRYQAETAETKLAALKQERDVYQFQLAEALRSHSEYVVKLSELQRQKQLVHVVYKTKIRSIDDAQYTRPLTEPLVIFSMRDFDAYSTATR